MKKINIGLAGLGTIGAGVVKLLTDMRPHIRKNTGIDLEIIKAVDLDENRAQSLPLEPGVFSKNLNDIIDNPDIQIAIELMGGIKTSEKYIMDCMAKGKHIVTANKALLAERFDTIFSMADEKKVNMGFEASVAGGIPIIKILQESFMTNKIRKIFGILNGTTNYILTKMTLEEIPFDLALKQAQEKGFAEADPTLDIDGVDAAHKALILANLAFGTMLDFKSVMVKGIRNFNIIDIKYANQLGYTIKLLAVCKRRRDNSIEIYVEPALVPQNHLLASVQNEFNAVYVDGEAVGETVFYGRGAGAMPTANSVISDIIDMSRDISTNHKVWYTKYMVKASEKTNLNIKNKYYLRISTHDKPGVLGKIAGILGDNNISISSCVQKETSEATVPLILTTHKCQKDDIDKAVAEIQKMKEIKDKIIVLNIQ